MKKEQINELFEKFEAVCLEVEGVEFWSARELQKIFGYTKWDNFANIIEKGIQIAKSGLREGVFIPSYATVNLGSGAFREVLDYKIDKKGVDLLSELSSKNKLNVKTSIRSETIIIQQIEKYCRLKSLFFAFQFHCKPYRFDCKVGQDILVEFQEQHHQVGKQREIDAKKRQFAQENNYKMLEITIEDDIIDIIVKIEKMLHI